MENDSVVADGCSKTECGLEIFYVRRLNFVFTFRESLSCFAFTSVSAGEHLGSLSYYAFTILHIFAENREHEVSKADPEKFGECCFKRILLSRLIGEHLTFYFCLLIQLTGPIWMLDEKSRLIAWTLNWLANQTLLRIFLHIETFNNRASPPGGNRS